MAFVHDVDLQLDALRRANIMSRKLTFRFV